MDGPRFTIGDRNCTFRDIAIRAANSEVKRARAYSQAVLAMANLEPTDLLTSREP